MPMINKIQYGMVGGGEGAFIGEIHRMAARMDNHFSIKSTNILILFAFLFLTECVQRFHYSSFLTIHSCSGSL